MGPEETPRRWGLRGQRGSERAQWEPHQWGKVAYTFQNAPDHIRFRVIFVPEGLAVLARCDACGGRREGLVDQRQVSRPELQEFALEAAVAPITIEWLPHHAECSERPMRHVLPEEAQAVVEQGFMQRWRQADLERIIAPRMVLVLRGGRLVQLDAPEGVEKNQAVLTQDLLASLRDHIRAEGLDVVAALLMHHAHLSGGPGAEQRRAFEVLCVTESWGTGFVAEIPGVENTGAQIMRTFINEDIPALDGLFATTDVLPLSERDALRAEARPLEEE